MLRWKTLFSLTVALASGALVWAAPPAPAAGAAPMRITFVGPLTEVHQAPVGQDALAGARLYTSAINEAGGVAGRKLEITAYDDHFKPDETMRLAQQSVKADGASAFITIGTAPALAVIQAKVPEDLRIPMFPMRTGAGSVREPFNPYVFHVRAGYRQELEKIVSQLLVVGIERIALLYQDDPYGQFGRGVVRAAMQRQSKHLVVEASYDRTATDLAPSARVLSASGADAIVMVAGGAQSMQFVQHARDAGFKGRLVGLSDVDPGQLLATVGNERARNVSISQVFPNLNNAIAHPLVREFKQHLAQHGGPNARSNNAVFEGWLTVKVIAEGLKRAAATKRPLKDALETFTGLDLGSYRISLSPTRHEGSAVVDLLVIGTEGRIIY